MSDEKVFTFKYSNEENHVRQEMLNQKNMEILNLLYGLKFEDILLILHDCQNNVQENMQSKVFKL